MSDLRGGLLEGQNLYRPYFTTTPLTRLSFVRHSNELLDKASKHRSARYLLFKDLNPLRKSADNTLEFLSYDQVSSIIGEPYAESEKSLTSKFNSSKPRLPLVFLGLDLAAQSEAVSVPVTDENYTGTPYFALDVSSLPEASAEGLLTPMTSFPQTRVDLGLPPEQSAIYAQSRSYLDWHAHNKYCSSCGNATLPIQGGTKMICPPTDAAFPSRPPKNCQTRTGLHNTAFARTDPTLIAAAVSADNKRVLLGRGKRWTADYWSCLSGFVEPAESMETATRREVWEESGVKVGDVMIHSSQAWPYPSTLLVGTIGVCEKAADERIWYPEKELGEAKWFEFDEVEHALNHGHAMWEDAPKGYSGIRLPGDKLMAHRTLRGVLKLFARR